MRLNVFVGLVVALFLGQPPDVVAHVGNLTFPIYELPVEDIPDLHDGSLEDWEDVLPGASLYLEDLTPLSLGDGAGFDPQDLDCRAFLAWNSIEQRIYLGIERVDNVYVNTYEGGSFAALQQHDSIGFMVDGDHSGGVFNDFSGDDYSEEEIKLLTGFQAQQYVAIAESPDGRLLRRAGAGDEWGTRPPWGDVGGFQDGAAPNTSFIELAITPWDELNWAGPEVSLRSRLEAGKIIGFQLSISDFDAEAGQYHGFHTLGAQSQGWRDSDTFADGELIPCDLVDCSAPSARRAGGGTLPGVLHRLIRRCAQGTRSPRGLPFQPRWQLGADLIIL